MAEATALRRLQKKRTKARRHDILTEPRRGERKVRERGEGGRAGKEEARDVRVVRLKHHEQLKSDKHLKSADERTSMQRLF